MNLYYITSLETFLNNHHCFHPTLGSAYLGLSNGIVLVSAHFLNHSGLEHWESQKDVVALPHPVLEGTKPIADNTIQHLSSLGIKKGHTVLDVAKTSGSLHPLMKLRSF